jgi:hypothetical protein
MLNVESRFPLKTSRPAEPGKETLWLASEAEPAVLFSAAEASTR